ncbi:MAG: sodium-dependent bicarbonate transport family permease [Pseudomonadota bacterium]
MDILAYGLQTVLAQLQKPTLAFLIGGMLIAALGSRLEIPDSIYKFIVVLLLLKVGLNAGLSIQKSDPIALLVPALCAVAIGVGIVVIGSRTLALWPGVSRVDAMATAGVFGAVSASTLAACMTMLDSAGIAYEGFIGALYPFMDIAALVTAIVLARLRAERQTVAVQISGGGAVSAAIGRGPGTNLNLNLSLGTRDGPAIQPTQILTDTLRSPAISALLLGIAIGMLGKPQSVYESFYEPLFRGLLSVLMLIMGIEAWSRLGELRKVAHAYVAYAVAAPILHGVVGFALGMLAHELTGFSAGGVVLLAVMAASSSDISGPPTIRGALPEANASAYVGASTGIGTPIAILSIPLWIALADAFIGLQ